MSLNETELALAIMDDDGWGCAIAITPEPPTTAEITWSEIRYYRATVPLSELANAVRAPGSIADGHPLPADLREMEGDPFDHGDFNGLLCDLEPDSLVNVENIEVARITKGT